MTLHFSSKNCWSFVIGVCVVGLALITLVVDPQHIPWLRWQILVYVLGVGALISLIVQAAMQSKEDHDRDVRENARDARHAGVENKLNEIAQLVSKGAQQNLSLEPSKNILLRPMNPPVNFDADKYFNTAYQSKWTADVEARIKVASAQNASSMSPEDFYSKFIGTGLVAYMHDITWAYIWKSQFLMLVELNRNGGMMPVSAAKAFFNAAVKDYPSNYTSYTFDQWLGFITSQGLITRHPSEMLEITVRGRDFLSYSAHSSRSADQRKG